MIWLENSHGDTADCSLSDLRNSLHHKDIHSLDIVGNCNPDIGDSSTHRLSAKDYDFFPRSELHERLGDPSDSMQGQLDDERSLSLLSSGSDKTNVSIYENLSQTSSCAARQYSSEMKDLSSVSSDSVYQQKLEDSKTTMIGMYIIDKTIGKGNFSVVKSATHKSTQVKVAIKIIDKTRLSPENLEKIRREVKIMKVLHHPHIVRLYQVMESDTMIYIVMEFVPNGEIFDYVATQQRFKEDEARQLFFQIVSAIEYCHERRIVHRDLKAENLLLDDNMNIKLADFGFGNYWQDGNLLNTFCGSPPYAAPEIFKGEKYNGPKADIWSLGVVLYVLVTGSLPFEERTLALLKELVVQAKFRIPFWMTDDCEDLIRNMLRQSPDRRFTIRQILNHRWLRRGGELPRCPPTPCLAEDMSKGIFNEQILSIMEQKGMLRKQIIESLSTLAYDHRTALYLLLGEKMRRRVRGSMPEDPAAMPVAMMQRRPSSVAESLMANRGGLPTGRELQTWLTQQQQLHQQQQQQQPPPQQQHIPQQQQPSQQPHLAHPNVIDAMQTSVTPPERSSPLGRHSVSGIPNAWPQQLSTQMQNMAISPPTAPHPTPSKRQHALTISVDVTSTSPVGGNSGRCRPHHFNQHYHHHHHHTHHSHQQHQQAVQPPQFGPHYHQQHQLQQQHRFFYRNHHHQTDDGPCCLATPAGAQPGSSGHVGSPIPVPMASPLQQHRLHPAWAPAHSPGSRYNKPGVPVNAPPPSLHPHHFNEGRRASDVGLLGTTGGPAVRLETPFAPIAARAAGLFDLLARGAAGDSLEAELLALSGVEAVDFVAASQLPSQPSFQRLPSSPDPNPMELDPSPVSQHHRLSLPVACAHPAAVEEAGSEAATGGRRACCLLPTIVSAPPDEENGAS